MPRQPPPSATADPLFLAFTLVAHQLRHGLADADLAAELGWPPGALPSVKLCRHPGAETFDEDARCVAGRWGLDAWAVA